MPGLIDFVFALVLVVVASVFEHYVFWPRFRADVEAGVPGARLRAYRRGILGQWTFTLVAFWIWISHHRSAEAWRFVPPHGWRLALAIFVVGVMIGLFGLQLYSVARLPAEQRVAARPKVEKVAFVLPHNTTEYGWFLALSATAGFCEELLYRGYLAWLLTPWLGAAVAMFVVVVIFGASHSYQGVQGATRATLAGAVMAAIVVATNSLFPAMIVHALVNSASGTVGYWLLRDYAPEPS